MALKYLLKGVSSNGAGTPVRIDKGGRKAVCINGTLGEGDITLEHSVNGTDYFIMKRVFPDLGLGNVGYKAVFDEADIYELQATLESCFVRASLSDAVNASNVWVIVSDV